MKFRKLRADEIECRISQISKTRSVSLLLYKDARCDMRILDETVGAMNWQRDHKELKGNMYCGIALWDEEKNQWIWKWDCGTESYTEAQKGEASDSFKRACFNAGIGRELYTAPQIWVSDCTVKEGKNGKPACYDRFRVKSIDYDGDTISGLTIVNEKTNKVVFRWGNEIKVESSKPEPQTEVEKMRAEFIERCNLMQVQAQKILEQAGWSIDKGKATAEDYDKALVILDEIGEA